MSRKLKIGYSSRKLSNRTYKFFPQLILSGNWLEENGFSAGQAVEVTATGDKITITRLLK